MVTILLAVQGAIYFHAANVALAAAARGAAAAAPESGTANGGESAAARAVAELGGDLASPPIVEIDAASVRVTATVRAPRIVPFFPTTVSRSATEPRERYVAEDER